MSAPIEFRFEFDDQYLLTSLRRHRATGRRARWQGLFRLFVTPFFLALVAFQFWNGTWGGAVAYTALLLLLWFGVPLEDALARRRLLRSPLCGLSVRVVLRDSGMQATDARSDVESGWKGIRKVRAFDDGVLVYLAEKEFRWLPHAALVEGTPEEVETLLYTNVPEFVSLQRRKRSG